MRMIGIKKNGVVVLISKILDQRRHLTYPYKLPFTLRHPDQHWHAQLPCRCHNGLQRHKLRNIKMPDRYVTAFGVRQHVMQTVHRFVSSDSRVPWNDHPNLIGPKVRLHRPVKSVWSPKKVFGAHRIPDDTKYSLFPARVGRERSAPAIGGRGVEKSHAWGPPEPGAAGFPAPPSR